MARADSNTTTRSPADSSRRRFLTVAAAASAVSVTALAAAAMPVQQTCALASLEAGALEDPIFTAIENHKAVHAAWVATVGRHYALEEELPEERRRSHFYCGGGEYDRLVKTDDPRWIETAREVIHTSLASDEAALALLTVTPTTRAGILALLQHAVSHDTDGQAWPVDLEGEDGKTRTWHHFLLENLAKAIATI
jgi:hypothetical protein